MRYVTWCALAGLLVLGVSAARVDANGLIPPGRFPPQPPPQPKPVPPAGFAPLVVVADDNVKEPRLEIPRKLLRSLRASRDEEGEPETQRAEAAPLPRLHTLLAGCALSLGLVTGGLWLVRSRNRSAGRGLMLLLVTGGLLIAGSGVLWADIGPRPNPFGPRPNPLPNPFNPGPGMNPAAPLVLPDGITLADKVAIVIVEKGNAITLVVNRDDLAKVVEKTAPDNKDNKDPKVVPPVLPGRPILPQRPGLPPG
jgi:hypothetical protein